MTTRVRLTTAEYKRLANHTAGSIDDQRWYLAGLAARARDEGLSGWCGIMAALPTVRRAPSTVYEWAEITDFRNRLSREYNLPWACYYRAFRFEGKAGIDRVEQALETIEGNNGTAEELSELLRDVSEKPEHIDSIELPVWIMNDETIRRLREHRPGAVIVILPDAYADTERVIVKAAK